MEGFVCFVRMKFHKTNSFLTISFSLFFIQEVFFKYFVKIAVKIVLSDVDIELFVSCLKIDFRLFYVIFESSYRIF